MKPYYEIYLCMIAAVCVRQPELCLLEQTAYSVLPSVSADLGIVFSVAKLPLYDSEYMLHLCFDRRLFVLTTLNLRFRLVFLVMVSSHFSALRYLPSP